MCLYNTETIINTNLPICISANSVRIVGTASRRLSAQTLEQQLHTVDTQSAVALQDKTVCFQTKTWGKVIRGPNTEK